MCEALQLQQISATAAPASNLIITPSLSFYTTDTRLAIIFSVWALTKDALMLLP